MYKTISGEGCLLKICSNYKVGNGRIGMRKTRKTSQKSYFLNAESIEYVIRASADRIRVSSSLKHFAKVKKLLLTKVLF